MEQYTLLIMTKDKVVHMKVFNTMKQLLDAKRYFMNDLKDADLKQVDKYGYVWFAEANEEDE